MRQSRRVDGATRSRRLRAVVLLLMLIAVAGAVSAARAAQQPVEQPRPMAATSSPTPGPVTPRPSIGSDSGPPPAATSPGEQHGRQVFLRDCAWCHGQHAQGTGVAPSLLDKGSAAIDFWLSTGRMPLKSPDQRAMKGPPAYSSRTISDIVDYLGSLGPGGKPIPVVHAGDEAEGQSLFITHCAACHNTSGTGVIVVNGAVAPQLYGEHPRQIAEAIRTGPGEMPAFSSHVVDQTQLDDLVAYASSLGDKQVRGGNGLDQYGPIFEGSIVWLIPVPVLIGVLLLLGQRRQKQ